MDPDQRRTADVFDAYEDSYNASVDEAVAFTGLSVDFFTRVKADYIRDLARRHFGDPRRIAALDIGCGIGNFHPLLAPAFGSLDGIDVSPASIARARARNPGVGYTSYAGARLPYEAGAFDLVLAICVMHHVPPGEWPDFVAEMRRVLRPGGLALVFEHNPRNPLTMRVINKCPFDSDAVLLRSERTAGLFVDANFRDVRQAFILSVPPINRMLRRIDRLFAPLPLGAQYYVAATRP